jgi:hypothetical protein
LGSGSGVWLVGVSGEGGSVEPENEEARFLDEQVLRVSGGLREVEEALALFWGGVREEDWSVMVRIFQESRMLEFEASANGAGAKSAPFVKIADNSITIGRKVTKQ